MGIGVSTKAANPSGAASVTTPNIVTTSGRTLIAFGSWVGDDFGATPIQDSKGNTWTALPTSGITGGARDTRFFKAVNITGGSGHNFTINCASGGNFGILFIVEIADVAAAPTVLAQGQVDDTTPYVSGTIAPSAACVLVGAFLSGASAGTEADTWGGSFAPGDKIQEITDADSSVVGSCAAVVKGSGGTYESSVTVSGASPGDSSRVVVVSVETSAAGAADQLEPWQKHGAMGVMLAA